MTIRILLLGFSFGVILVWTKYHFWGTGEHWFFVGLPLLVPIVFGITTFLFFKRRGSSEETFSFRPLFFLPLFFFFILSIFNIQAFLRGFIFFHQSIIPLQNWVSANVSFIIKSSTILLLFFILTITFFSVGNLCFRLLTRKRSPENFSLQSFLVRIMGGIAVGSSFLLMFGFLHILSDKTIWITFLVILILEWKTLRMILPLSWKKITIHFHYEKHQLFLFSLGFFLIAFLFIQSLKPEPTGYDDMTRYMSLTHTLAIEKTLPHGGSFPFELLSAGIKIGSRDPSMTSALSFTLYSLLLGALVLFSFTKDLSGMRSGILATALFLSLPVLSALTFREAKPDPLLVATSLLSLWLLYSAIQSKQPSLFFQSLFFFAFAITVKLSALLLITFFIAGLFFLLFQYNSYPMFFRFRTIFLSLFFFFFPLFPWICYAASTTGYSLFSPLTSIDPVSRQTLTTQLSTYNWDHHCSYTGYPDLERFDPHRHSFFSKLLLPWDMTMNLQAGIFSTEIGFLFLALLPWWFMTRKTSERKWQYLWYRKTSFWIGTSFLGYFLLWIWHGWYILWYALPGITLLILPVVILKKKISSQSMCSLYWIIISLGLVGNTLIQMKIPLEKTTLQFLAGTLPAHSFLNATFLNYDQILETVNQKKDIGILTMSTRLVYGIDNRSSRVVEDNTLDFFQCLNREHDNDLTLSRFQAFGIRYVLYPTDYNRYLQYRIQPTFSDKVAHLTRFLGEKLSVTVGSPSYLLFEVPSAKPVFDPKTVLKE